MSGPRVLSLFAGIGGLDLGLESYGCTTVAYSEVDPYASAVMAMRFPGAVNLGDITTIDWIDTRERFDIDIICGGFPCQDISLAGKGAGIAEGTRSVLWSCYADAIRVLRPRGVLVENVAALLNRGIDRVLGDLAACGYDAEWDCIPAAAVGAPHLRDRVFIVATRADVALFDPDTSPMQWAAGTVHQPAPTDPDSERIERPGSAQERRQPAHSGSGPIEARRAPADARSAEHEGGRHEERRPGAEAIRWPRPEGSDWWRAEPDVGRVAHGVPRRVDRLRCPGNAVVPQVAEHVAGILMERIER